MRAFVGLTALIVFLSLTAAEAVPIDVWDLSQGAIVTGHSPVAQFSDYPHLYGGPFAIDMRDMFGGNFSSSALYPNEIGNVRFRDGQAAGTVHWVEWMTPLPVLVDSFVLQARGDGPEVAHRRDYSSFRLFGKDPLTGSFTLLYEFFPASHPQPEFLSAALPPVSTREYRAEFTQYSSDLHGGPRIFELDGFGTTVPEPSSSMFLGIGVAAFGLVGKRLRLLATSASIHPDRT